MAPQILLQDASSVETRTVTHAVMLADAPPTLQHCSLAALDAHQPALRSGDTLPVGSVEFVRRAMELAGIPEPSNMSYPLELQHHLKRYVRTCRVQDLSGRCFVKPMATKQFTGFVWDFAQQATTPTPSDQAQLAVLSALPEDTLVWASDPVTWVSEWRAYVDENRVLAIARYDELEEDDVPEPDMAQVAQAAAQLIHKGPCALDFGVLANGQTALVEMNDFWSLGLYDKALTPKAYLSFLFKRWAQLSGR